jgi:hypothetical protein
MTGRNHVVPKCPASCLLSRGLRLLLGALFLVVNVSRARGDIGITSHSNTVRRITDRFFSWLPRREELNDDSSFHSFEKLFRMKNQTKKNWYVASGDMGSSAPPTWFPWRPPSIVHRSVGNLRVAVPYWAFFPARRLWASNGGKGLALASVLYWTMRKCSTSEPVQRSLYFWKHAGPIVVR